MTYNFKVGDRVKVKDENPSGNPRTPRYVRGKYGVVVAVHGVMDNPMDHRGHYSPLYTVSFQVESEPTAGKLCVDVHEEWLEKV